MGSKLKKKYTDQIWFWGMISESEAEQNLKSAEIGTFLVRTVLINKSTNVILSFVTNVRDQTKTVHRVIMASGKKYILDGRNEKHSSITELVYFYQTHQIAINHKLNHPKTRPSWFIRSSDISIEEKAKVLGAGNFSTVVIGKYKTRNVAIKKLLSTDESILKEKEDLMKEAAMMEKLKHPFIIKSYGIAIDKLPPMIVLELMAGGLLSHLKQEGPTIQVSEKMLYCWQLCSALAFMAERKLVHRDIAARNCLFSTYGVLKLTDFGMSNSEANLIAYCTTLDQMPVRWMPPETLLPTATFNEKTDVWSFAVVCNEIFQNGIEPLSHINDTKDVIEALFKALKRMPDSQELHQICEETPAELVSHQKRCWNIENSERPNFAELATLIDLLLKNKYIPPPVEEISTQRIKSVKQLTIAEYELLIQFHLDSEDEEEEEIEDQTSSYMPRKAKRKNTGKDY